VDCAAKASDFDLLILIPKDLKESKLLGKRHSEHIRVKILDFCVKHERCEDIFCATNQILQIKKISKINKSVTQNADVAFQLRAIGQ
jgi:hypothetical protein